MLNNLAKSLSKTWERQLNRIIAITFFIDFFVFFSLHRRHRHHGKKGSPGGQTGTGPQPEDKVQAPAERIHFLLGEEDEGHEVHPLFSEMEVLTQSMDSGDYEWREAARWIKYEEVS